jgi:hypothetical protein
MVNPPVDLYPAFSSSGAGISYEGAGVGALEAVGTNVSLTIVALTSSTVGESVALVGIDVAVGLAVIVGEVVGTLVVVGIGVEGEAVGPSSSSAHKNVASVPRNKLWSLPLEIIMLAAISLSIADVSEQATVVSALRFISSPTPK